MGLLVHGLYVYTYIYIYIYIATIIYLSSIYYITQIYLFKGFLAKAPVHSNHFKVKAPTPNGPSNRNLNYVRTLIINNYKAPSQPCYNNQAKVPKPSGSY